MKCKAGGANKSITKKEEGSVCRDQRGEGAQRKKQQPKHSQVRDTAGVKEAETIRICQVIIKL